MFTRCSACHTVHPLNAALLAQGAGQYRCGKCNKLNDALGSLFDEWPDAGQPAPGESLSPTLGISLEPNPPEPEETSDLESMTNIDSTGGQQRLSRILWIATASVLIILTTLNLAWVFRAPLLDHPLILDSPYIRDRLVHFGIIEAPPDGPPRQLDQLQLISTDLRSHPAISGALRLSATVANKASGRQPYPGIEVTLLNSSGEPIARRLFKPSEYLAENANVNAGMTPQAYLPIILDLSDPGRQAVGFEIKIR